MKNLKTKIFSVLCACSLLISGSVSAHPGRLDANGGHWNRKTGTYHYHSGASKSSSSSKSTKSSYISTSSSSSSSSGSTASVKKTDKVFGTSLKMYVKGKQIPTYYYNGATPCEAIVAEDLEKYGFDIKWVSDWNTLYISRNDSKAVTGTAIPYTYSGQYISDVYSSSSVVRLTFSDGVSYAPVSYSLGGRMIIPIDETKCLGNFRYSAAENAVYLD